MLNTFIAFLENLTADEAFDEAGTPLWMRVAIFAFVALLPFICSIDSINF